MNGARLSKLHELLPRILTSAHDGAPFIRYFKVNVETGLPPPGWRQETEMELAVIFDAVGFVGVSGLPRQQRELDYLRP